MSTESTGGDGHFGEEVASAYRSLMGLNGHRVSTIGLASDSPFAPPEATEPRCATALPDATEPSVASPWPEATDSSAAVPAPDATEVGSALAVPDAVGEPTVLRA